MTAVEPTGTASPWTDQDVDLAAAAMCRAAGVEAHWNDLSYESREQDRAVVRATLDALAPRVAELQRAAKVEALRKAADEFSPDNDVRAVLLSFAEEAEGGAR